MSTAAWPGRKPCMRPASTRHCDTPCRGRGGPPRSTHTSTARPRSCRRFRARAAARDTRRRSVGMHGMSTRSTRLRRSRTAYTRTLPPGTCSSGWSTGGRKAHPRARCSSPDSPDRSRRNAAAGRRHPTSKRECRHSSRRSSRAHPSSRRTRTRGLASCTMHHWQARPTDRPRPSHRSRRHSSSRRSCTRALPGPPTGHLHGATRACAFRV
jgi:hypothetical protein